MKIFKRLAEREEMNNWNRKWIKRKFDSLNLVDRNAYEQIIERYEKDHMGITYSFMWLVTYMLLYLAITAGILYFLLRIDIISEIINAAILMLKLWIPLMILGLVLDFIQMTKLEQLKRKLLMENGR